MYLPWYPILRIEPTSGECHPELQPCRVNCQDHPSYLTQRDGSLLHRSREASQFAKWKEYPRKYHRLWSHHPHHQPNGKASQDADP